jgi:hypothetical protein
MAFKTRVVSVIEQIRIVLLFLPWMSLEFTALTLEIDYNQTAVGLPPVTLAVFFIAKSFWLNMGVSEEYI